MNPHANNEVGGLNLPAPAPVEQLAQVPEAVATGTPETAHSAAENAAGLHTPAATTLPPVALPIPSAGIPQVNPPVVSNTTLTVVPSTADDADLIEKEWVQKAKDIINNTHDNPYQQSKEINIFKADYMKKRYNKTIKLSE